MCMLRNVCAMCDNNLYLTLHAVICCRNVPFRVRVRLSRKRSDDEDAEETHFTLVSHVPVKSFKGTLLEVLGGGGGFEYGVGQPVLMPRLPLTGLQTETVEGEN